MYEMYPEWGPARHRTEDEQSGPAHRRPRYWERDRELVGAGAPASRDGDGERPDDN